MLNMNWGGKIILGFLGLMAGGPFGLLLGLFVGHMLDRGTSALGLQGTQQRANQHQVQDALFSTVFSIMGHLAKADGRVSEQQIIQAKAVMTRMGLSKEQRQRAIELFNQGKSPDFPLDDTVADFYHTVRHRRQVTLPFLEILLQIAMADGHIAPAEEQILLRVAQGVGIHPAQFQQILAMLTAQAEFAASGAGSAQYRHQYRQQRAGQGGQGRTTGPSLAQAYKVLGVAPSATDQEVKKAYRRLMNEHHPDKLAARGVPEAMIRLSSDKAAEISKAYDMIRHQRRQGA